MNISERGKVFNSKTSIIETSSEKYSSYKGVHFLFARSYENISYSDRGSQVYAAQGYGIQSIGIGMTLGHEKSVIKNTSSQIQFDGSIVYDSYNYGASTMYFLFSTSIGMNLFPPPPYQKKSFKPLPPIRKKKTEPSSNKLLNTSEELFDPETGEPIKKNRNLFDSEPDKIIEKDPTEYDPETGEIIEWIIF